MARVTILMGKGGTGRTTIARAMALDRANHQPTALLHADPTTDVPDQHITNLSTRVLDPYQIIEDAMVRLIPLGPLTRTLVRHPAYESLLEVAPGIKEAAVLNFLYGFLDRRKDHVILDGPATGHGVHFLEAPKKLETVLTGKVAARLRNIDEMLHDPAKTQIVLVALPEELPALEVTELADTLDDQGFPVRGLVINRMPPPVPIETGPLPDKIPAPGPDRQGWGLGPDDALALMAAQRKEAEAWLEKLEATDLPTRIIPSLPGRSEVAPEAAPFLEGFPEEGPP